MLHEILMALAGYPGDVFVRWEPLEGDEGGPPELAYQHEKGSGWGGSGGGPPPPARPGAPPSSVYAAAAAAAAGGFRVSPQLISVFSESEREALERAVAPGHDLLLIKEFVAAMEAPHQAGGPPLPSQQPHQGPFRSTQHTTFPPAAAAAAAATAAAAGGRGLYPAALGRAARELIDPYLSCLVAAEDAALQQPQTPLAAISLALGDHPLRLKILRHVLSQVNAMALSAAATGAPLPCGVLLDFLWRGKNNGDPIAREVYVHLIDACAAVFSFQLCSWMLSGQLLDPYGEFFIVRRSLGGAPGAPSCPFRTSWAPQGPQHRRPGGPPSREEERPSQPGAPLMETEDFTESLSVEALVFEWSRLFRVSVRGAPLCCFAGAPMIWGAGSSLVGGPLAEGQVSLAAAAANAGAAAASTTAAAAAAAGVVLFVGRAVRVLARGGLWGEQQRQQLAPVALKIREAFKHPSSPAAIILPCVKALRAVASRALWTAVSEGGLLPRRLRAVRDAYLLGDGLFFTFFLESSRRFLGAPGDEKGSLQRGGPLALRARGLWAAAAAQVNPSFAAAAVQFRGSSQGGPFGGPQSQSGVQTPRQQPLEREGSGGSQQLVRQRSQQEGPPGAAVWGATFGAPPAGGPSGGLPGAVAGERKTQLVEPALQSLGFALGNRKGPRGPSSISCEGPLSEADLVLRGSARIDEEELLFQVPCDGPHGPPGPHGFSGLEGPCPLGVAMHPERQLVAHGFKHGFQLRLQPPERGGASLGASREAGACVALVLQSGRAPISLRGRALTNCPEGSAASQCMGASCDFFWPSLGDCVALEFRLGLIKHPQQPQTILLAVEADLLLGGAALACLFERGTSNEALRPSSATLMAVLQQQQQHLQQQQQQQQLLSMPEHPWVVPGGAPRASPLDERGAPPKQAARGPPPPPAVLLRRGLLTWAFDAEASLADEEIFIQVEFSAERQRLTVLAERGGPPQHNKTARALGRHVGGPPPLLEISDFDGAPPRVSLQLRNLISLQLNSAFVGFFSLPLAFHHRAPPRSEDAANGQPSSSEFPLPTFGEADWSIRIRRWYHEAQAPPLQLRCLQQQQQQQKLSIDAAAGPQAGAPAALASRLQLDPSGAPWPLPLLLNENAIGCYNALFSLLLQLRALQVDLQQLWLRGCLLRKRHSRLPRFSFAGEPPSSESGAPQGGPPSQLQGAPAVVCRQFWGARSELDFYISHIFAYFQCTVIAPAFAEVEETARTRKDFEEIRLIHDNFLTQLASRCWLRVSSLLRPLVRLLAAGRRFVELGALATRLPGGPHEAPPEETPRARQLPQEVLIFASLVGPQWDFIAEALAATRREYQEFISLIFSETSALKQGAPHARLGALALPLDFNGFLTHLTSGAPFTPRGEGGPSFGGPSGSLTPRTLGSFSPRLYTGAPDTARMGAPATQGQQDPPHSRVHPLVTPEAAGAPTAAAAAALGAPPRCATPRTVHMGGASKGAPPPRRAASVGNLRKEAWSASSFKRTTPAHDVSEDEDVLLHSCRSTDSADEEGGAPPFYSHSLGAPRRDDKGEPQFLQPLRRPSPPPRGPRLPLPSEYQQNREGAPPFTERAPFVMGAPPPVSPEEYRALAGQAREAVAEARRKMLERRGLLEGSSWGPPSR
ncbi:hypothetical protein Emed_003191 [Eimeria media]